MMASSEANRARRERLLAAGLCVICGRRERKPDSQRCPCCTDNAAQYKRDRAKHRPEPPPAVVTVGGVRFRGQGMSPIGRAYRDARAIVARNRNREEGETLYALSMAGGFDRKVGVEFVRLMKERGIQCETA